MNDARYMFEILKCLDARGGKAIVKNVYDDVRNVCRAELTAADLADLFSGEERFTNKIRQIRRTMIEYGLMEPMEILGEWQIAELGRKYLKSYPRVKLGPGGTISWTEEII